MRGLYDPDQRRAARHLERNDPAWLVMYGPWTRHFWAYPRFAAPRGTILHASSTRELLAMMRTAELESPAWHALRPHPGPG